MVQEITAGIEPFVVHHVKNTSSRYIRFGQYVAVSNNNSDPVTDGGILLVDELGIVDGTHYLKVGYDGKESHPMPSAIEEIKSAVLQDIAAGNAHKIHHIAGTFEVMCLLWFDGVLKVTSGPDGMSVEIDGVTYPVRYENPPGDSIYATIDAKGHIV